MARIYCGIFTLFLAICMTSSQMIIPKKPFGYVYANGSNDAPLHLDVHMSLICKDSRNAMPIVKAVADHYGASKLKLTIHMFPLPFHQQSFITAVGAHVIESLGSLDDVFKWFQTIFLVMERLSNAATSHMAPQNIIQQLERFAIQCCSVKPAAFVAGVRSMAMETKAKAAWKYSCSRGVASTPTYFLNDVLIAADPSWTSNEWKEIIDPLLL